MIQATTYVKMTRIHSTVGGNSKFYLKDTSFFKVDIFKLIRGFLEKTRDNLTSTSVKVVPLLVTSLLIFFLQKI